MPDKPFWPCPDCGGELQIEPQTANLLAQCAKCGRIVWTLADLTLNESETETGTATAFEAHPPMPALPPLGEPDTSQDAEPVHPDVRIKAGSASETLAVTALVVPLLATCILIVAKVETGPVYLAITWGAVLTTIVLMTIDAHLLGRRDLQGNKRETALAIFAGMLVFWIIFYPLAFFRRRHFGKSNLGPLALLIVVIFLVAPFASAFLTPSPAIEEPSKHPPRCDDRDVKFLVEDLIRADPIGDNVKSIGDYREIWYDRANKKRRGRCTVQTAKENITVTFEVRWIDPVRGAYQVSVVPAHKDPRGYLNLRLAEPDREKPQELKKDEGGVLVTNVHGEAQRAGVKPGDILVRVNNRGLERDNALARFEQIVIDLEPGAKATIELVRNGKRQEVNVTIEERPQQLP